MQAARRLYLYAMSGITLGVIAFGFVLLLQALLDGVFPNPTFDGGFDDAGGRPFGPPLGHRDRHGRRLTFLVRVRPELCAKCTSPRGQTATD